MGTGLNSDAQAWLSKAAATLGGTSSSAYKNLLAAFNDSPVLAQELNNVATSTLKNGVVYDKNNYSLAASYSGGLQRKNPYTVSLSGGLLSSMPYEIEFVLAHELRHAQNDAYVSTQESTLNTSFKQDISSSNPDLTSILISINNLHLTDEAEANVSGANAVLSAALYKKNLDLAAAGQPPVDGLSAADAAAALTASQYGPIFLDGATFKSGVTFNSTAIVENDDSLTIARSFTGVSPTSTGSANYNQYYAINPLIVLLESNPSSVVTINFDELGLREVQDAQGNYSLISPLAALQGMLSNVSLGVLTKPVDIVDSSTNTIFKITTVEGAGSSIFVSSMNGISLGSSSQEQTISTSSGYVGSTTLKTGAGYSWIETKDAAGNAVSTSSLGANEQLLSSQVFEQNNGVFDFGIGNNSNSLSNFQVSASGDVIGQIGSQPISVPTQPSSGAEASGSDLVAQPVLDFSIVASEFGSTLGRLIGGGSLLIGTALGSVISAAALTAGRTIFPAGYLPNSHAVGAAAGEGGTVWSDFQSNLKQFGTNAALGSASSYLAAELAQSLGLSGIGAQTFSLVSGDLLQYVVSNATSSTPVGLFTEAGLKNASGTLESGLAGFVGTELASLVVTPHTVAEATLASLVSSVAAYVGFEAGTLFSGGLLFEASVLGGPIGAAIGAFVGFILGDLFGSLFGHHKPRVPTASASTVLQIPVAQYAVGTETSANGGDLALADAMAKAARDTLNGIIAQITDGQTPSYVSNIVSPTQIYGITGNQIYVTLGGTQNNVTSGDQAVDKGVLWALPQTQIVGGDIVLKRAMSNAVDSTVASLLGDLQIASDYEVYLKDKAVIDAAISSSWNALSSSDQSFYASNQSFMTRAISASELPLTGSDVSFYNANKTQVDRIVNSISVSSFAAGWIVTLARAAELKLDSWAPSDFYGGFQGFLQSFGVKSKGSSVHYEDASLTMSSGNLTVSLGSTASGSLSLLPQASSDGTSVTIAGFGSNVGYTVESGAAISNGNDFDTAAGSNAAITIGPGSPGFNAGQYGSAPPTNGGSDIFIGGNAADTLSAGAGDDWIDGGAGDDYIVGGAGRDVLLGGAGNDTVVAGSGATYLSGGAGNDNIVGGSGSDTLVGGDGADGMHGMTGDDAFIVDPDGGSTQDILDGEVGSDTASFERFASGVTVDMSNQTSFTGATMLGSNGQLTTGQSLVSPDKRFTLAYQSDGNLVVYGADGTALWNSGTNGKSTGRVVMQSDGNLVIYDGSSKAVWSSSTAGSAGATLQIDNTGLLSVDRTNGSVAWSVAGGVAPELMNTNIYGDQWISIENVTGSNYADTLTASNYGSYLSGLKGNDVLNGGAGNDTLEGGGGADQLNGGGGYNDASYASSTAGVYVNLATGTAIGGDATGDILGNIQWLTGSANGDELAGNSAGNLLDGGAGDDWLDASAGADTYKGGDGYDTLDYSQAPFRAGTGTITYNGASYTYPIPAISVNLANNSATVTNSDNSTTTQTIKTIEQIIGTSGVDAFSDSGTSLNETWDGDGGNDTFTGGTGSDTYVFGNNYGNATISDTNAAANVIRFKSGITFDNLFGYRSGSTLEFGIRGNSTTIAVAGGFSSGNDVIKTLDLDGVAQVDLTQVSGGYNLTDNADVLNGDSTLSSLIFAYGGNDTINASSGSVTNNSSIIDGGLGNDIITTSNGDDQFLFERGDGQDVITDTGGSNTIIFGPTVAAGDVIYEVSGANLYVGIKDLTNTTLTASRVADHIEIMNGALIQRNVNTGAQTRATSFSVEAGGTTTDLTQANIAWTYQNTGGGGSGGGGGGQIPPIVLDLSGDGLEVSSVATSDIATRDAAGNVMRVSWVGPTNGILAYDRNADGLVDESQDISFIGDKAGAKTDLEGLAGWDTNADGILNAKDTNFSKLVIWVDANQDGRSTPDEIRTLAQAGVTSINLTPNATGFDNSDTFDSVVSNTTSFTRKDGSTGTAYDVSLARELLSGASAATADPSIDLSAPVTFGRFNDASLLSAKNPLTGIIGSVVSALADFTNGLENKISQADATRWAAYLDPTAIAARKAIEAAGGSGTQNIDVIRTTVADVLDELTGRGADSAKVRLQSVVVDMTGAGLQTIDPKASHVAADVMHTGSLDEIGWASPTSGVLAYDSNGDGLVDIANETDFRGEVPNAKSSLQGLSAFDTNGDGVLGTADASFARFLIWRDLNGNGISDKGEVQTLSQAGISQISLSATNVIPDQGSLGTNQALGQTSVTMANGTKLAAYDVAFGFADTADSNSSNSASGNVLPSATANAVNSSTTTDTPTSSTPAASSSAGGVTARVGNAMANAATTVASSRSGEDGPTGEIVQSTETSASSASGWWQQVTRVGNEQASDNFSMQFGPDTKIGTDTPAVATPTTDAATLQRQQLLRQAMASFLPRPLGGSAAVWNRQSANDPVTIAGARLERMNQTASIAMPLAG